MNRFLLMLIALTASSLLYSQSYPVNRCPYKGIQITDSRISKEADDFTITTTDGITRNLYTTLDSGKTVFVDLFYTTCSWCQYYSPVIEEVYQNNGAGQGDIEFWGISNNLNDPDAIIDQYKTNYNVSNPCAGPNGGGTTAHTTVISGQNFQGWPTYVVICPDRTLFFDPCYPPIVDGFDPYFETCAATIGIDDQEVATEKPGIFSVYPNPAKSELSLDVYIKDHFPVSIELINLLGEKLFSSCCEVSPGKQTINIPTDKLPNGAYFIKMMQTGQVLDIKKALISN
jgi:thiol-disulfide isomerase/thioredoxin